jgi:hypothetical protein
MRYIIFSRSFTNKNYLTNYFQELAEFRQQLNLPLSGSESDRATVAKLEIGDRGFLVFVHDTFPLLSFRLVII